MMVFSWPVQVYYEDTDAGGVVYHSQYLNFMERARTEWLRTIGYNQSQLKVQFNVVFVVHSLEIAFKKPAKLDDALIVQTQLVNMGYGSFSCEQTIIKALETNSSGASQSLKESKVLIKAQVKVACVDAQTFKPVGIPNQIKQRMELA
jgi:tol-pal system-associated acyl-CoA thioesterase